MPEILSVGECMVEMARRRDGAFDLRVGGDTFNTAIYLSRLGVPVSYMTAVGDDPYSAMIVNAARSERIGTDAIRVVAGRMPGLYLIETASGERSFWYWRDNAPARDLFELPDADALITRLAAAGTIYLSGITLSLYSTDGLDRLAAALAQARQNGARVVIDSNYRPAGWRQDTARAQIVYARFWALTDIALPSFDDEQALWGDNTPDDTFARLTQFGVGETCLKMATGGAMVTTGNAPQHVPPAETLSPVGTTAAGDSFSAAYLAARLDNQAPARAAAHGNRLAGIVIQHPGAIAPAAATASFTV
ncbi:MAG: sugar kinase [Hyphomicrobiaceae bacterium]